MNNLSDSSLCRLIRVVYDLHGINFVKSETLDYISEGLIIMGIYCRNLALHCIRVSNYSTAIGKSLGLSAREIKLLWYAAIFHDIGKCNIPLEIYNKPAKLTEEEYSVMKTHSRKGYEYVKMSNDMDMEEVSKTILYHHERFDGKGYPLGLEGSIIPMSSRIVTVADAYDSMISERSYRKALSHDSALNELRSGRWTQFDGNVVDCFIDLIED